MAAEGEDEAQIVKLSAYTDWVLRHYTFSGQVEEDELIKEAETE